MQTGSRDLKPFAQDHTTNQEKKNKNEGLEYNGRRTEASAKGDGGYDAFVKALKKCLKVFGLTMPRLQDYQERIPPGGRTDALVETTITWSFNGRSYITTGVDSDQLLAAVAATEKMLNIAVR